MVRFESKQTELLRRRFDAGGIVASIQVGRYSQTSLRGRGADEVENLLVAIQRLTGAHSIRELAHGLAAATPDDADLQVAVFELLREEDAVYRSHPEID